MRVLVTRPQTDAAPLLALLEARGHEPLAAPLLHVHFDANATVDLTDVQAVLLTSANGARALAGATAERKTPLLTVGGATASAVRDAGFVSVTSADGDLPALAGLARRVLDPAKGRLVHIAGRDVAGDLVAALPEFSVDRFVLYRAETVSEVPAALREALTNGAIDAALFYSPRTAATFVRLLEADELAPRCRTVMAVCLSGAVANALRGLAFQEVVVADRPDQDHLLAALDTIAIAGDD